MLTSWRYVRVVCPKAPLPAGLVSLAQGHGVLHVWLRLHQAGQFGASVTSEGLNEEQKVVVEKFHAVQVARPAARGRVITPLFC